MRKILLTLVVLLFAGCGSKAPVLTVAVGGAPNEVAYWEQLIQDFEKETGIKVKVMRQPTDTEQRRQGLLVPLKAGQRDPDVFLMDVIWVPQFAASDWLLSLDYYVGRDSFDLSGFFAPIIDQVDTYENRLVALPVYNDCGLLYFRKDLLNEYGCDAPRTWSELVRCAERIQAGEREKNPGFFGFVWQGAQYEGLVCNFLEYCASNNGRITDRTGEVLLVEPENIAALAFMADLIHKYKVSPPSTYTEMKEEEVRQFFQNGNAAFERNWPYAWALHEDSTSPVRGLVGVTLLPEFAGGRHAAALGGWHVGISAFSDAKDDAWRFVSYVVSRPAQKRLASVLGWNPGRKDLYDDPELAQVLPNLGLLADAFEHAVARPSVPYYTQLSDVLQRELNAALAGRRTPAQALSQAQAEAKQVVSQYGE